MISVLMCTYNEKVIELKESIESILNQSYANFEFIIVNDGPDNVKGKNVLNYYAQKDKRIKIIENEINIGLAASLNKGLDFCNGEYLARMDADDISMPDRLEKEMEFLKKYSLDLVSCFEIRINETGDILEKGEQGQAYTILDAGKLLVKNNFIKHPTVMGKTAVFREVKGYRFLVPAEDYDMWLKMLSAGKKIGCMSDRLLKYRVRHNGISRSDQFKQFLTSRYVRSLYKEREKRGKDSYTDSSLKEYLVKHKYNDKKYQKTFENTKKYYENLLFALKSKKIKNAIVWILKTLSTGRYGISIVLDGICFRIERKYYSLKSQVLKNRL